MEGEGVTPILKISIRIVVMAGDTQIAKTSVLCSLKFFNSCLQGQLQEQLHKLLYGWFPGQPSPVQPYRQSRAVLQMDLAELPWVHTGCGDGTSFHQAQTQPLACMILWAQAELFSSSSPWSRASPIPRCTPYTVGRKSSSSSLCVSDNYISPVGSHSTATCFHNQPVTPSFSPNPLPLNNSDAEKLPFKMLLAY